MGVFVSYSSRDREAVTRLTDDLQTADEQVWIDQRLAGGDAWWRAILEQIRECDVFVFALSQNSIQSKPCQAELHYAQDLGLPILPVQVGAVDSMQLNPLATLQSVDYRNPTPSTGMRLISALNQKRGQRQPLPSRLPDEPAVPFEYLIRLYSTLSDPTYLSPRDQASLLAQLEVGLREDGEHDAARNDIVMLLRKLREREDVTYRTRTDIDSLLASIDAVAAAQPAPAADIAVADIAVADVRVIDEPTQAAAPATQAYHSAPARETEGDNKAKTTPAAKSEATTTAPVSTHLPRARRSLVSIPQASWKRRAAAILLDLIPIVVVYLVAYVVAVTTRIFPSDTYTDSEGIRWTYEYVRLSPAAVVAVVLAGVLVIGYGVWNFIVRPSRKGATIGQSMMRFKRVDAQTLQPTGFRARRIVAVAIPLLVLSAVASGVTYAAAKKFTAFYNSTCVDTRPAPTDDYYTTRCTRQ